jgi:hypothetical protein
MGCQCWHLIAAVNYTIVINILVPDVTNLFAVKVWVFIKLGLILEDTFKNISVKLAKRQAYLCNTCWVVINRRIKYMISVPRLKTMLRLNEILKSVLQLKPLPTMFLVVTVNSHPRLRTLPTFDSAPL